MGWSFVFKEREKTCVLPQEEQTKGIKAAENIEQVEETVDSPSEQAPAEHIEAGKNIEGNPEDTDYELEQTTEEDQEKPSADETGEKLDV